MIGFSRRERSNRERLALDQFHAEKQPVIDELAELVDRDDARVLQLAADLGFFDEPLDDFRVIFMGIEQDLDCEVATEVDIVALEDPPMPPRAISPRSV